MNVARISLSGRIVNGKDRLTGCCLAQSVELDARAIDTGGAECLQMRGQETRDLDLILRKEDAMHERVRIVSEDRFENVPPFLRGRMRLLATWELDAEFSFKNSWRTSLVRANRPASQALAIKKIGRSNSVTFCQARNDKFALLRRKFLVRQITSNAAQIGHAGQVVVEFKIVRAAHAHGFEMIRHAGRAIDDADILDAAILPRRLVDDMADLRKAGRLEPVEAGDGPERRGQHQGRRALQHALRCQDDRRKSGLQAWVTSVAWRCGRSQRRTSALRSNRKQETGGRRVGAPDPQ